MGAWNVTIKKYLPEWDSGTRLEKLDKILSKIRSNDARRD